MIENHYLGDILKKHQFDTFYHEHPRTYSLKSFEVIAQSIDKKLLDVEFPQRYGGNIRVFIGRTKLKTEWEAGGQAAGKNCMRLFWQEF